MENQKLAHQKRRETMERKELDNPPSVIQDAVPASSQVIIEAKEHYRNVAKNSTFISFILAGLVVLLTYTVVNLYNRPPLIISYLQDNLGNLVAIQPLNKTGLTEADVLSWASKRTIDLQMVSFADYRDHLTSLRGYFVPEAFMEYQNALLRDKAIDRVKNDQLVKYAKPVEAPVLQSMKVVNGVLTWVVTMKISEHMAGGEYSSSSMDLEAEITIVRSNTTPNLDGLRVSKYLVSPEEH